MAVKAGLLERQPCEICGSQDSYAHHKDYFKPLDARFLCQSRHQIRHGELRKLEVFNPLPIPEGWLDHASAARKFGISPDPPGTVIADRIKLQHESMLSVEDVCRS